VGNEEALFPFISSCNIACGGHAGNVKSMGEVVSLAQRFQLKIGAHPSYPDRENFGRNSIAMAPEALKKSIMEQVDALLAVLQARGLGGELHHIKPHGALYNDVAKNRSLALVFLEAVRPFRGTALLYAPYGSILAQEALRNGFKVLYEAFADRSYLPDLGLAPRNMPDALIQDPIRVLEHIERMIKHHLVATLGGSEREIFAETYCIHGDTPNVLEILTYLSKELPNQHIYLKK
jgi:UPF0271 protein